MWLIRTTECTLNVAMIIYATFNPGSEELAQSSLNHIIAEVMGTDGFGLSFSWEKRKQLSAPR